MKKTLVYFFSVIVLIAGCTAVKPPPVVSPVHEEIALKDLCGQYNVNCEWDTLSFIVSLKKDGAQAKALINSDMVLLGREIVALNEPVRIENSTVVVPPDFKYKVMERLRRQAPVKGKYTYRKVNMVILDPGHGGKDPGAIGRTGLKEKEVVLDIARRVKELLLKQGIKVMMTRDRDKFVSLKDRTKMASSSKADIFVSIHANAHNVRSIFGVEIYSLRDLDYYDKNETQRKENHQLLYKQMGMKNNDLNLRKIMEDLLYTNKQSESELMASCVSKRIAAFARTKNRGSKHSHFYVLRNTLIPAVLIEVGFLSNPKEERLLRTSSYRQKIAMGIVNGILDYAKCE